MWWGQERPRRHRDARRRPAPSPPAAACRRLLKELLFNSAYTALLSHCLSSTELVPRGREESTGLQCRPLFPGGRCPPWSPSAPGPTTSTSWN